MSTPPAPTSSGTVTVASKLPFPLRLQLQKPVKRVERDAGGTHEVESYVKTGKTVVIQGCARPVGVDSDKHLVGGFALTHDVDADFWAEWVKQHEGFEPLEKGLIFAAPKGGTQSEAKNRRDLVSGFEPLNPSRPPAEFSGVTPDA